MSKHNKKITFNSDPEFAKIIHKRVSNQFFHLLEEPIPINDFQN